MSVRWCGECQHQNCAQVSEEFSNDTDVTQRKFISQLIIQEEMWIHYFVSETEQHSVQWNE